VRRLCAVRLAGWSPVELLEAQDEEVRRDHAEGVRLAYVAATRARDLLVVPAIGDERWGERNDEDSGRAIPGGWLSPLNDAIYPSPAEWSASEPAPACPEFGRESVLDRPHDDGFGSASVRPGLHHFGNGESGYDVVWWDPRALKLDVPPLFGVRQEELMSKEVKASVVREDVERHRTWTGTRDRAIERATVPSLRVQTATERAVLRKDSDGPDVELVELERDPARPVGPRFGALVHAVLATVPLGADADGVRRATELQSRILGATAEEIAAAQRAVIEVLAHPLLERARKADGRGQCRRETPVTFQEDDGVIVDGVVDLAFADDAEWTVVDFKTDRELERELPVYRRQVGLYADVIAAATGQPVTAVLMKV
ncbi:MAG: PD-(D/E)XK nuclease family protein, partial [Acidobacteriota bacterium]|nr:PD-(D/E)XK nuclease family protein [Acidobacteriota bacterium]